MIIEYGIPIPKRRSVVQSSTYEELDTMRVGGSVTFDTLAEARSLAGAMRVRKMTPVLRQVREKGRIRYRVWRES